MPTTDEKDSKPTGSWKDSLKTLLYVVSVVAFIGAGSFVNTYYFNFSKLAEIIGGLLVILLLGGVLVYVFWVGLKTILSGKDKK
jgi:hypothetical protein